MLEYSSQDITESLQVLSCRALIAVCRFADFIQQELYSYSAHKKASNVIHACHANAE